jgi:tetratricopeptide (TPR) repeat protein
VLLCLREEALTGTPPLSDWLFSMGRALPVTRLRLSPLSAEETMRLVRLLGSGDQEPEQRAPDLERLGQWLFAETAGQPFFLLETLKALLEQGLLTLRLTASRKWEIALTEAAEQERQWRGLLPSGVRELIRARLARLSPDAGGLLAAAAVLGQGFTFEHLAQVAQMPEQEGVLVLEEILKGGLLQETNTTRSPTSEQPYTFTHDKIREVVYSEVGEARRRLLHRRALDILQRAAAPMAALAHHALAAKLLEPACRWSVAAGDEAARLFATTKAQQHYTLALEALAHLPESEEVRRQRVETILKLVNVSWTTESPEQHLARLAEAEQLSLTLAGSDRQLLAQVHYWIGFMAFVRHALREAKAKFQQVLVEAQELGDEGLQTLASVQIARTLTGQGQFGQVEALLVPVISRLEAEALWTEWIFALGFLGVSLAARGHYTAGLAAGQQALARAQVTNSRDHRARSHFFLSVMYGMGGDLSRMVEESGLVVELAQQSGDWVLLYLGYGWRGWAESRLGQSEAALESMARSQDLGRQHGERLLLTDWLAAAHAEVLLAAGRVEAARAQAEAAVELARAVGGLYGEGLAQRVWGQTLAAASSSHWAEAEAHLAASIQALETGQALLEVARTQVVWGQLCRERGNETGALEHFEKAAAQLEDAGLAHERLRVCGYLIEVTG